MGDIKGEMNMYADDISVSETEVKGKLKKIKNSEEYRKFEQNEQRQAEKNGTWMHLEIDSHSSNEEFARVTAAVFMSRMNPTMEELEDVKTASAQIPILRSANMSLGVNTVFKLAAAAAKILGEVGYDIEIVEKHHNQKLDAPSGTAIALADSINEAADGQYEYVYDRSQVRKKRDKKELGISAVRGGTIVGEHEVLFAGIDEVIEFKHTAYSRTVFGKGAVEAAKFLAGKEAGKYDMSDVVLK